MSRIRANNIVNGAGTGAPTFPNGAVINGITTITADVATTGNNLTIGTGTTISNPSDNEFRILTNGGERVRVDSSGNVGIGTTNPQRSLHIYTGDNAQLVLESTNTLNDINLTDTGGSARIRNSGGELRFFTGGDPSSLNVANGSNNVAITTDGNMEIANGNLVFSTAGTGIDFSATGDGSGTATSELLDDYEEGSWTPIFADSSGAQANQTYSVQRGRYVKVGRHLTCTFDVQLSAKGTFGGVYMLLGGLPYTSGQTANLAGTMTIGYYSGFPLQSQRNIITGYITLGNVYIMTPGDANGSDYLTVSDSSTQLSNNSRLIGSLSMMLDV